MPVRRTRPSSRCCAQEGLTLATDRLTYFAHWITPEEQPLRFDTRFFAAVAPLEQEPEVDGHEIVALRWQTPAEAIAALRRKEITLRLPTIKNVELLQAAGTRTAEILTALHGRRCPPYGPGSSRWTASRSRSCPTTLDGTRLAAEGAVELVCERVGHARERQAALGGADQPLNPQAVLDRHRVRLLEEQRHQRLEA